jgi:undecaprenyl-diphosphatase
LHRPDIRRGPLRRLTRARAVTFAALAIALLALAGPATAATAADEAVDEAVDELTAAKAIVLGVVEGVTEYLPISSTGHLHVTQRLLGIGETPETKDAADTYAITIQAGAILAVLLLYRRRLASMIEGALGHDDDGRGVLLAVAIAFLPAGLTAFAFEDTIKDNLFGAGPIVAAWIVGGIAILLFAPRLRTLGEHGVPLEAITPRTALLIGVAQILALWPGTSRSLVTILAAIFLGLSIRAAVEFSFLLGFVTLTIATLYEAATNGADLLDTYGVLDPLLGFLAAFVSAVVAIRWMVAYLERHDLSIFGWYRLAIAAITLVLLATDVI